MKVVKIEAATNKDAVKMLEQYLTYAKSGEIINVAIIAKRQDGQYVTAASSTSSGPEDAAIYIEIAMRKLGFALRSEA